MDNETRARPTEPSSCAPVRAQDDGPKKGEEYRCPVCRAIIPPEQRGRKIWCRKCGYLESCRNPED